MAEIKAESNHYITDDTEENKGLIPDSLGLIVQELYQKGSSDSDRKTAILFVMEDFKKGEPTLCLSPGKQECPATHQALER